MEAVPQQVIERLTADNESLKVRLSRSQLTPSLPSQPRRALMRVNYQDT
jgi:hypothetical protein